MLKCISKINCIKLCVPLIGTLFFTISISFAAQLESVARDFAVIKGYVVQQVGQKYIIDLDAGNNIQVNDLFVVLANGIPIVHPVSKKVIGSMEKAKGILKVTQIKDGYSYAMSLSKNDELKPGDPIKRYSGLKVKFWDHTENGKSVWKKLQRMLPDLYWDDYLKVDHEPNLEDGEFNDGSAVLHFILTANQLKVCDAGLDLIRLYTLAGEASDNHLSTPRNFSKPKKPGLVNSDQLGNYFAAKQIGEYQGATTMADLVSLRGRLLMASTDGWGIDIHEISSGLKLISSGQKSRTSTNRVLALKWWYPSNSSLLHLVSVVWSGDRPASNVFIFENNDILPVLSDQKSIFGTFDFDKDGLPETLLSQQFDPDEFYGSPIRQMSWDGGTLKAEKLKYVLPRGFTVIGSQFADLTNDGKLEAIYVRRGVLKIYSGSKALYTSPKRIGGTLSALTYEKDASFKDYQSTTAYFEITPVDMDIDRDGQRELLVFSSKRPAVRAPGIGLKIVDSRLAIIHRKNGLYGIRHQGPLLGTPVQGIWKAGNRVIYLLTEKHEDSESTGLSRIYELTNKF